MAVMKLYQCDICKEQIEHFAGRVRIDYRNAGNSGGREGNDFHSCAICREKLIKTLPKLWDIVEAFLTETGKKS